MSTSVPGSRIAKLISAIPEGSTLTIVFDTGMPEGTGGRIEFKPDKGFINLGLFELTADPEVKGAVYVVTEGAETKLAEVEPSAAKYIDVDEVYGALLCEKLILEATIVADTTSLRTVTLKYSGGLYQYRGV
ncbi:MAG: hypothetical protein QXR62_04585 [Candidatus Bathyarchaeia archaeon]